MSNTLNFVEPGNAVRPISGSFTIAQSETKFLVLACKDTNGIISYGDAKGTSTVFAMEHGTFTVTPTNIKSIDTESGETLVKVNYTFTLNSTHSDIQSLAHDAEGINPFTTNFTFIRQQQGMTGVDDTPMATANVMLEVKGTNDAPIINIWQHSSTIMDLEHTNTAVGKILFTDVDGDSLSIEVNGTNVNNAQDAEPTTIEGLYGTLILEADGNYTYTANDHTQLTDGQRRVDTFTIKSDDGTTTVSKAVSFTIVGTNDAPTIDFYDTPDADAFKGLDPENGRISYLLVNDLGTAYVGKASGSTVTYTTEYGIVKFMTQKDGSVTYSFAQNNDHPAISLLAENDELALPFYVQSRDAQGLLSHSLDLSIRATGIAVEIDTKEDLDISDTLVVGTISAPNGELVASGAGRNAAGDDIHTTSPATNYAGKLVTKGTISLAQDSETIQKYSLFMGDEEYTGTTRGATTTYVTEYGTMTISKTAVGANYTFTLSKTSDVVKALDHNDSFTIPFEIRGFTDGKYSEISQNLHLSITGTNDKPILSIIRHANDVTVNANEHMYDSVATGKITIADADAGDSFMQQTLSGKATLVPNVIAQETPDSVQAEGTILIIEGKYGNLTIHSNGDYTYALATDGPQAIALAGLAHNARATETFTITTTDNFNASHSQNVAFTVIGTHDAPMVVDADGSQLLEGETALSLNYINSGYGRNADGTLVVNASPEEENAFYTAKAATGFIAVNEFDARDVIAPVLYDAEGTLLTGVTRGTVTTYTIASESPDSAYAEKIVFTRVTKDGQLGFEVSFSKVGDIDFGNEEEPSTKEYTFAVKDTSGLESEGVILAIDQQYSSAMPSITIQKVSDFTVYSDTEDTNASFNISLLSTEDTRLHMQSTLLEDTPQELTDSTPTIIEGKYGNLVYDSSKEPQYTYILADPDAAAEEHSQAWNVAQLQSSLDYARESFTLTATSTFGQNITENIDITVYGENRAPEVSINPIDESLVAAGLGRSASGSEHTNVNLAYAGNLVASGKIDVVDVDKEKTTFTLHRNGEELIGITKGLNTTFTLDEGTLLLTQTNTGYTYKFTMNKNAEAIKSLDKDGELDINIDLQITDLSGNAADPASLTFTIIGTNDAPVMSFSHASDLIVSAVSDSENAPPNDNSVSSEIILVDDANDSHSFTITRGKDSTTLGEEPGKITLQGAYGDITIDTTGEKPSMTYTLAEEGTQYAAALALGDTKTAKESFVITVTDAEGVARSQTVTYTVRGSNDFSPEFSNITYGAAALNDATLKAAGFNDASNRAYAGDLVAKGSLVASDDDKDSLTFSVADSSILLGDPVVRGTTTTYTITLPNSDEAIGTLSIVKANTTTSSYTFTLSKTNSQVQELVSQAEADKASAAGEDVPPSSLVITIPLMVSDGRGGSDSGEEHQLQFTVQGSNDGPILALDENADTDVIALTEISATGTVLLTDPDSPAPDNSVDADSYVFSISYGRTKAVQDEHGTVTISGKYGDLVFNPETLSYTYTLGKTTAQENSTKLLKEGQEVNDNFILSATDADKLTDTLPLSFTITGSNDAPEVLNASIPDALIMPGVGRNGAGLDAHDASGISANLAYKGDFISKGTVTVKDYDVQTLTYSLDGYEPTKISGATSFYTTEYGTLALTKTAAGVSYSLTLDVQTPAYQELIKLTHNETLPIGYTINISDGTHITEHDIAFTVTGTNTAPEFIHDASTHSISLGAVQANIEDAEHISINYAASDADGTIAQMSISIHGKTESFTAVDMQNNFTEGALLVEGTYGNVYVGADSHIVYEVGVSDAQKMALQSITAHKQVADNITLTVFDNDGAKATQVIKNTLVGSDVPLGQDELVLKAASGNTFVIEDGIGRNAQGVDITTSTTIDHELAYVGDFTASGSVTVHATYKNEGLHINDDYGTVHGNTTTFTIYHDAITQTAPIGSLVLTKTAAGYSYVFTANKHALDGLAHGEEHVINPQISLGDTHVSIDVPITIRGTNDAPEVLIKATNNDFDVLEAEEPSIAAASGTNDTVSGTIHMHDVDDNMQYITINGQKLTIQAAPEEQTIEGTYGNLVIMPPASDDTHYSYTYALGVTDAQIAALKAHSNFNEQHEVFTLEAFDDRGASTAQNIVVNIGRHGAPTLTVDNAQTTTEDANLYDNLDSENAPVIGLDTNTVTGSFAIGTISGIDVIEVTGATGTRYDFNSISAELLATLRIDGTYGTFSNFAMETIDDVATITYTYTQYVDAPHSGESLEDSIDVRIIDAAGVVYGKEKLSNTIIDMDDSTASSAANDALNFTSGDNHQLLLPGILASNKAYAGDITTTGKVTGTEYNDAHASFSMYDMHGAAIPSETHGIYTKFFSEYGTITLTQTATGINYSFTLNKDHEDFKELPQGFTTSFPFTLVVSKEGVEVGREDVGIIVRGTNDAPTAYIEHLHQLEGKIIVEDIDIDDTHSFAISYGAKTVKVADDTGSMSIAGKYGDLVFNENTQTYEYILGGSSTAQQNAYAALPEGEEKQETFYITTTDATGAFVKTQVIIQVSGQNDAFVLGNDDLKMHALQEPGVATKAVSGFYTFTDVDGDKPIFGDVTFRGNASNFDSTYEVSGVLKGTSTVYETQYGTLTLTPAVGRINYTFKLNDKSIDIQELGNGEELSLYFTLDVSDGQAASETPSIAITVTGTNDVPSIQHETFDNMVVGYDANLAMSSTGTLDITDLDTSDTHIIAVTATNKEHMSFVYGTDSTALRGTYGTLTIDAQGEYAYSLIHASDAQIKAYEALATGAKATDKFTVTVNDGNGGTSTKVLTFNVIGNELARPASLEAANDDVLMIPEAAMVSVAHIDAELLQASPMNSGVDNGVEISYSTTNAQGNPIVAPDNYETPYTNETYVSGHFQFDTYQSPYSYAAKIAGTDTIVTEENGSLTLNGTYGSLTIYSYGSVSYGLSTYGEQYEALTALGADGQGAESFIIYITDGLGNTYEEEIHLIVHGSTGDIPAQVELIPTSDTNLFAAGVGRDENGESITDPAGANTPYAGKLTTSGSFAALPDVEKYILQANGSNIEPNIEGNIYTYDLNSYGQPSYGTLILTKNGNTFDYTLTLNPENSSIKALALDEELGLNLTIQGVNDKGFAGASSAIDVTITGTNDAPEIMAQLVTIPMNLNLGQSSITFPLSAIDYDTLHGEQGSTQEAVTLSAYSAHLPGHVVTEENNAFIINGLYGRLELSGNEYGGKSYTYRAYTEEDGVLYDAIEALGEGRAFESFAITATDPHGASSTENLNFNIIGAGDLTPVGHIEAQTMIASGIGREADGSLSADLSTPYTSTPLSGQITVTDPAGGELEYVLYLSTGQSIVIIESEKEGLSTVFNTPYGKLAITPNASGAHYTFSEYTESTLPAIYNTGFPTSLELLLQEQSVSPFVLRAVNSEGEELVLHSTPADFITLEGSRDAITLDLEHYGNTDYVNGIVAPDDVSTEHDEHMVTGVLHITNPDAFASLAFPNYSAMHDANGVRVNLEPDPNNLYADSITIEGTYGNLVITYQQGQQLANFTYELAKDGPQADALVALGQAGQAFENFTFFATDSLGVESAQEMHFTVHGSAGDIPAAVVVTPIDDTLIESGVGRNADGSISDNPNLAYAGDLTATGKITLAAGITDVAFEQTVLSGNLEEQTLRLQPEIEGNTLTYTVYHPQYYSYQHYAFATLVLTKEDGGYNYTLTLTDTIQNTALHDFTDLQLNVMGVNSEGFAGTPTAFTFSITGTNNNPILQAGTATGNDIHISYGENTAIGGLVKSDIDFPIVNGQMTNELPTLSGISLHNSSSISTEEGTTLTIAGKYGVLVLDTNIMTPNNYTSTYTLYTEADGNNYDALANLADNSKAVETFEITATDSHGATTTETLSYTLHKGSTPLEIEITLNETDTSLIAAGFGRDEQGALSSDANAEYAGDLTASGSLTVSGTTQYTVKLLNYPVEGIIQGNTTTFNLEHGSLVFTKTAQGYDYEFTLNPASRTLTSLAQGNILPINLGISIVDTATNTSQQSTLSFEVLGTNDAPEITMQTAPVTVNLNLGQSQFLGFMSVMDSDTLYDGQGSTQETVTLSAYSAHLPDNVVTEESNAFIINGLYGKLQIFPNEYGLGTYIYLPYTEMDGPLYDAIKALGEGRATESFTITGVDPHGASSTENVSYNIIGVGDLTPVGHIEAQTMIASGIGREADGSLSADVNIPYTSTPLSGQITITDPAGGELEYVLYYNSGQQIMIIESEKEGLSTIFNTPYGKLAITPNASGAYYTFSEFTEDDLPYNNHFIENLIQGHQISPFILRAVNSEGEELVLHSTPADFITLVGSNNAITFDLDYSGNTDHVSAFVAPDDVSTEHAEHMATGIIHVTDPESLYGWPNLSAMHDVNGVRVNSVPDPNNSYANSITIEGTYGNLVITYQQGSSYTHFTYELAKDGPQADALAALGQAGQGFENFTLFATDAQGVENSQEIHFTVHGSTGDIPAAVVVTPIDDTLIESGVGRNADGSLSDNPNLAYAGDLTATGKIQLAADITDVAFEQTVSLGVGVETQTVRLQPEIDGNTLTYSIYNPLIYLSSNSPVATLVLTKEDGGYSYTLTLTDIEENQRAALHDIADLQLNVMGVNSEGFAGTPTAFTCNIIGTNNSPVLRVEAVTDNDIYISNGENSATGSILKTEIDFPIVNGQMTNELVTLSGVSLHNPSSSSTEEGTTLTIAGKYGVLILTVPNDFISYSYTSTYTLYTEADGNNYDALANLADNSKAVETFEITATDPYGATTTETLSYNLHKGATPLEIEITLNETDTSLITAGFGRDEQGALSSDANAEYAGDLTASGSLTVSGTTQYSVKLLNSPVEGIIQGNTTTFNLEHGSLVFTKTAQGYDYEFTLNPTSGALTSLAQGDILPINLGISIVDTATNTSQNSTLSFEVLGSNDANLFIISQNTTLNLNLGETMLTGNINFFDPDSITNEQGEQIGFEEATLSGNSAHDTSITLTEENDSLTIEGLYGKLLITISFNGNAQYTYTPYTEADGAAYDALLALGSGRGQEIFNITTTDPHGTSITEDISFSIVGQGDLTPMGHIEPQTIIASGIGREADGSLSADPNAQYSSDPIHGQITVSDPDGGTLSYVLYTHTGYGSMHIPGISDGDSIIFETPYGILELTPNATGASYIFTEFDSSTLPSPNSITSVQALKLGESVSPFTLRAVNSNGKELVLHEHPADFITIEGSNDPLAFDVRYYGNEDEHGGILSPDNITTQQPENTLTGQVAMYDPDSQNTDILDFTFKGQYEGSSELIESVQDSYGNKIITIEGTYGNLQIIIASYSTSAVEFRYSLSEAGPQKEALEALGADGHGAENFVLHAIDIDGVQNTQNINFTVHGASGDIPATPVLTTTDSTLIEFGIGRNPNGTLSNNDNLAYAGDLVAKGSIAVDAHVDHYVIQSMLTNDTIQPIIEGDTQTFIIPPFYNTTLESKPYATLVLTKNGNVYDYTVTLGEGYTPHILEGATETLPFTIFGVNDKGLAGTASNFDITITGTNNAPVINILMEKNTSIINLDANENSSHGYIHAFDYDYSNTSQMHITDPFVLSGQSIQNPASSGTQENDSLTLIGKYGILSITLHQFGAPSTYSYTLFTEADGNNYEALAALADGTNAKESFSLTATDSYGGKTTETLDFIINNGGSIAGGNTIFDYALSGVGRDAQGDIIVDGSAEAENTAYTAKTLTQFIPLSEEMSGNYIPVLMDAEGTNITGSTRGIVTTFKDGDITLTFTKATENNIAGFKVAVSLPANYTSSAQEGETVFTENYAFAAKVGSVISEASDITINVVGSNALPVLEITSTFGSDSKAYAGNEDSNTWVSKAYDPNTADLLSYTVQVGSAEPISISGSDPITIEGMYGNIVMTLAPDAEGQSRYVYTYTLAELVANPLEGSQAWNLAQLQSSLDVAKESFAITVTDENGAHATNTIEVDVYGENKAPVVQIKEIDDDLMAAGLGRTTDGSESSNANSIYAGNLIANGTITINDADKDSYTFTLHHEINGEQDSHMLQGVISGTNTTFTLDEGTLVLTKSATGYNYRFTLNKNAEVVKSLQQDAELDINLTLQVTDAMGNAAEEVPLSFTIIGTNDAPIMSIHHASDLTLSLTAAEASELMADSSVSSTISISDDIGDTHSFTITYAGKVAIENAAYITTQAGKYGDLTIDNSGEQPIMTYTLADASDPRYATILALGAKGSGKETFTITVIDEHGVARNQAVTYTVRGENTLAPEITNIQQSDIFIYDDGYGREANGTDSSLWNKVYKGDLIARGTIIAKDGDGDVLSYGLVVDGHPITPTFIGTTASFDTKYGTITITNKGIYTFTADKDHPEINALAHGETLPFEVGFTVSDNRGGISDVSPLTFMIEGSDDGPSISLAPAEGALEADLSVTNTPEDAIAKGIIHVIDIDNVDFDYEDYTYKLSYGNTTATSNAQDSEYLTLSGKYGTLTFNLQNNEYNYTLNSMDVNFQKLNDGEIVQENFTLSATDIKGISTAQTLEFSITGTNDVPTINIVPTTSLSMDYAHNQQFKGTLKIQDVDLADDTLKELKLEISGVSIDTTKNGTTQVHIYETDIQAPNYGESIGMLSVTISGNACSYVYKPALQATGIHEFNIVVTDNSGVQTTQDLTFTINEQHIEVAQTAGEVIEGGATLVGSFAHMEAFAAATWADVSISIDPQHRLEGVEGSEQSIMDWEAASIPVDVNGMGKPDAYFTSNYGTLAFFYKTGEYVFNPSSNSTTNDITFTFALSVSGKDAALFSPEDALFNITLKNNHSPEIAMDIEGHSFYDTDALTASATIPTVNGMLSITDLDAPQDEALIDKDIAIIYNGAIYRPEEDGTITITANYGELVFDSADGSYTYTLAKEDSENYNPHIQDLEQGQSAKETFTFATTDAHNNKDYEDFVVTINGTDSPTTASLTEENPLASDMTPDPALLNDDALELTIGHIEKLYTQEIHGSKGNDLIHLDVDLKNIHIEDVLGIDGGDGMDVLLAHVENLDTVKELINQGKISDMEIIVGGNTQANNADAIREELGLVDDDNDGKLDLENHGWVKTDSTTAPANYTEFTNETETITVLIQQTLLNNAQS